MTADSNEFDKFVNDVAILSRKLLVATKNASDALKEANDVAWQMDNLVIQYAQKRQKEPAPASKPSTASKAPETPKQKPGKIGPIVPKPKV